MKQKLIINSIFNVKKIISNQNKQLITKQLQIKQPNLHLSLVKNKMTI